MKAAYKKLSQFLFDTAAMAVSEHGSFPPLFLLVKEGKFFPILVGEKSTPEEYASIAINAAHIEQADALILISEQWVINMQPDDPRVKIIQNKEKHISEMDGSDLFLTLLIMSNEGELHGLTGKIHRDKNIPYIIDSKWVSNISTSLLIPWCEPEAEVTVQ